MEFLDSEKEKTQTRDRVKIFHLSLIDIQIITKSLLHTSFLQALKIK